MELPNKKKMNQLDFLNNEIKNNDNEKPNFLNKSISSPENNNQNQSIENILILDTETCLLYTSPSPRDLSTSRMPSSA